MIPHGDAPSQPIYGAMQPFPVSWLGRRFLPIDPHPLFGRLKAMGPDRENAGWLQAGYLGVSMAF